MRLSRLLLICGVMLAAATAHAGGPRWFTGLPYYTVRPGQPVAFFTPDVTYYTDPGALNAAVSHAQADAMVAAAAAVWNVPSSRLTLTQGGALAQHLSSANVFFDGQQMVFPDDVKLANYRAKPIAIVYDTDGSVIDTLLGSGASAPSGCRTNGVVEDVDGLDPMGTIDHAILILNGRCVGSTAAQLTQMQYQLMRAFGRVLGLAWSQLNDNIFTGAAPTNSAQMANWPVMHPIDVICGTYTYQCMQNPFVLRTDDLSALAMLYPVTSANAIAGKTLSQQDAVTQFGWVRFPTGQGMEAVNIVLSREEPFQAPEKTFLMSAVTGANHQQYYGNLVSGMPEGPLRSSGEWWGDHEGYYIFQRIPIVGNWGWDRVLVTSEPINPLYQGEYAISGYVGAPPKMSGSPVTFVAGVVNKNAGTIVGVLQQSDAASTCTAPPAGNEFAPVMPDSSGWWVGQFCGSIQAAWLTHTAKAGRSWTLEVTATDETGAATNLKVLPVIGVYKASDATGTAPTVASVPTAMNSMAVGTTQLRMVSTAAEQTYRVVITDQRGNARPDYTYKARLLYADRIAPAQIGPGGGVVTITGEGFRLGVVVKVNGVNATVLSATANQITAITPSMSAAHMSATDLADITVVDSASGGVAGIRAALSYAGTGLNTLQIVTAPAPLKTGTVSGTAFSVRVLLSDGVTPARGASVRFAATGATAVFSACAATVCTLTADAMGIVQSTVLATNAGTLTLSATELSGGASVQAVVAVVDPVRVVTTAVPEHYIAPATPGSWNMDIGATVDGLAAANAAATWSAGLGLTLVNATLLTALDGHTSATVSTTGLTTGTEATVQGCVWVTVCASMRVIAVDPAAWMVRVESGAGQSVAASGKLAPVVVLVTDSAGHPIESAQITIAQSVDAWQAVCSPTGRCPVTPVLTASRVTAATGADGRFAITPLEVAGMASLVNIAVIAGSNGFVSLSLMKTP